MPKSRVIVEFPDRPAYAVRIGGGLAAQLGADLRAAGVAAERCLVVADADAAARCLPGVKAALEGAGFRVTDITVPIVEPAQSWECVAELHAAFAQLALPADAPIVVCAEVQVAELAAFAVATYGDPHPLVLAPASLASVFGTLAADRIELDAGYPASVVAPAAPAFAVVDPAFLASESEGEADLGLYELEQAAALVPGLAAWVEEHLGDIAAYDEAALVNALTQALAARADAVGRELNG